jgi:hypothetical protein
MTPRLYLETTIVSYLVARPSRDVVLAAHQSMTHDWWRKRMKDFQVFVSEVVLVEAGAGDEEFARQRLQWLTAFPVLRATSAVQSLTAALLSSGVIPRKAAGDAAHIAHAAVHGMHFLLTWNCRHIANAEMLRQVEKVCASNGFACPVVCTPHELMGN